MPDLPQLGPQQKGTVIYVSTRADADFRVRFTVPPHGYYCNVKWDSNGRFLTNSSGPSYHIFQAMVTYMKLNYSVQIPHEWTTGTYRPDGNWTGSLAPMQAEEVDFSTGPFIPTEERTRDFQMTIPFYWDTASIVAGQSFSVSVNVFGYVRIFSWQAWILTFCAVLLMSLLSAAFEKTLRPFVMYNSNLFRRKVNKTYGNLFGRYLFNYATSLLLMGIDEVWLPGGHSLRVLLSAWLMAVLVLMQVFTAQIRATLLVKTEPPRVDDAATVIQKGLIPFMWRGSAYPLIFKNSNDSYLMEIERRSVAMRSQFLDSELFLPPRLTEVLRGRGVMIADTVTLINGVTRNCMTVPPRQRTGFYYVGRVPCNRHYLSMMMRREIHPKIREAFDEKIREMFEAGLVRRWSIRTLGDLETCNRRHESQDSNVRPLDLDDVQGLFYMLILSLAFDGLLLLAELALHTLRSCLRRRAEGAPSLDEPKERVSSDIVLRMRDKLMDFRKLVVHQRTLHTES